MEFFNTLHYDYNSQNYDPRSPAASSTTSSSTGSESMINFNMEQLKVEGGGTYLNLDTYHNEEPTTGPYLKITEQPVNKFRFRYISEMHGTHGALMGLHSSKSRKTFPSVELCNYNGKATIQCSIYQADPTRKTQHSHKLVVRQDNVDIDDPHRITVDSHCGYIASFKGMGIIHTAKKFIAEELQNKLKKDGETRGLELTLRRESQLKEKADREAKSMNLNQVCLCFEALVENPNGPGMVSLCEPVYSKCINNMKSALTGELKICRLSTAVSSCSGQDDLFLFVEKVGKKNIKVKFFELDENDLEVWHDWGVFTEIDVHHQYAIALKTPPYRNVDITAPVDVFIQLIRPSDDDYSEPMPFKYKPRESLNSRKRQRENPLSFNSSELPLVLPRLGQINSANVQPLQQTQTTTSAFLHPLPMAISEEFNKQQMIDDLLPPNEECNFSGISVDLDLLAPVLQYDGEVKPRPPVAVDLESSFFVNLECDKIFKIDRIFGISNPDSVREKITGIARNYSYTTGDSFFHNAVRYGDESRVRKLLQTASKYQLKELLIECDFELHQNLLHVTCEMGKPEYIRTLVNLGVNPCAQSSDGNSPLHLAVLCGSVDCVRAIIDACSMEVYNNEGFTPLHLAIRNKKLEITRILLDAGFSVNSVDRKQGNNSLHLAVISKSIELFKSVLSSPDVEINSKNTSHYSALDIAKIMNEDTKDGDLMEICELLKKDPNIGEESRQTAAKQCEIKEEKTLIDEKSRSALEIDLNGSKKWMQLAHALELGSIVHVCETSGNPTAVLFNFIEMEDRISETRLKEELDKLKELSADATIKDEENVLAKPKIWRPVDVSPLYD